MKAKKRFATLRERFDDESTSCSSESERSDRSDDDVEDLEASDVVSDSHSVGEDDSLMHSSDIADDSASSDKCCSPSQYSDESE